MNAADVADWRSGFCEITLDLGAGDGRFVRRLAQRDAAIGAIALDLCAENLQAASRAAAGNALFVAGDALALPAELRGVATRVTITLPWGSLLRGLLAGDPGLLAGLGAGVRGTTALDILINAGAVQHAGWTLEAGRERIVAVLGEAGANIEAVTTLGRDDLRQWPTTWAKRLTFGRDPRAVCISATLAQYHRPVQAQIERDVPAFSQSSWAAVRNP